MHPDTAYGYSTMLDHARDWTSRPINGIMHSTSSTEIVHLLEQVEYIHKATGNANSKRCMMAMSIV